MSATSNKPNPSVIFLGLPSHHHYVPLPVQDKVQAGLKLAQQQADAADVRMTQVMVAPEEFGRFREELGKGGWDAVIIGNGIRSTMELTGYMERAIAAVRELAPQAVVVFNTTPDDSIIALRRWFPNIKQA